MLDHPSQEFEADAFFRFTNPKLVNFAAKICIFLKLEELTGIYFSCDPVVSIAQRLLHSSNTRVHLKGLAGSSEALIAAAVYHNFRNSMLVIKEDKEQAAYFLNDLENIFGETELPFHRKQVLFYPTAYRRPYEVEKTDNANVLLRTEVLKRLGTSSRPAIIVTYPEALSEKVVNRQFISKNTLRLKVREAVGMDFITDMLAEYGFERVDFVIEPGQFAIRGGLVDLYSYSNDYPFRIEFDAENVNSIRSFDPLTQLSIDRLDHITVIPNLQDRSLSEGRLPFFSFLPEKSAIWITNILQATDKLAREFDKVCEAFKKIESPLKHATPEELLCSHHEFLRQLSGFPRIHTGSERTSEQYEQIQFRTTPQPAFNKNMDLLFNDLNEYRKNGYRNFLLAANSKQQERLLIIFDDLAHNRQTDAAALFNTIALSLHEGFADNDRKLICYTDHQIFERYHRFRLRDGFASRQKFTLKELYDLKPGDYVTHVDHGIGRFEGLEKIQVNGRQQEAIRLTYKENDLLYVSIHSLHRISKFSGKDGTVPSLDRLGSSAWKNLKNRTKQRVKDIARELIALYAKRRASEGVAYPPDTYLQHELEASFIYEDTPDQIKTTADVKKDMEANFPMDRLVCGDVGFGKTEIAIRAAFKAVADSKQVAVLVPTTILALQHYHTFTERLGSFPCRVDYINRFKNSAELKKTLADLKKGTIDVLIGTHRILSKDVEFKELGLLIVDEEQKFGVSAKEKLRNMKVNIDTLTLTATPIPRTLQFSLMGARDLSMINTPPPNRYPVQTELHPFDEEIVRDAIQYEISRGGQVFFVNNRILNITEIAGIIQRLVPDASVAVAHGQMEGSKLEKIMLGFIGGHYDVLVSTAIIESGLDIPNANTIIINEAHHFGLSDLHQLRGRVGRSNKKAFCYLLTPPLSFLTDEAKKRLKAIEEFADIGSGFSIAMRDLDIRGAGNILGAEQSGFISEIGLEMYQRILDEAITELKENEFGDIFTSPDTKTFVRECQIETDLEILLPDHYVSNVAERLNLYKELDNINNESDLNSFSTRLADRFGELPAPTQELISTIRLRWIAKDIGFEKIVLKNNLFTGYFIANPESGYYGSHLFTKVLDFIKCNPRICKLKEYNQKLSLQFFNVRNVGEAINMLSEVIRSQT